MLTIYFILFCLFVAYLIFWLIKNDDMAEFTGEVKDKRFKPPEKKNDDPS